MALPVQYLIRKTGQRLLWLSATAAIFLSCSGKNHIPALPAFNADSIVLTEKDNFIYNAGHFFTGRIYKLSPGNDTLFVQDILQGLKNGYSKFFYETGMPAEIRYFAAGKKEDAAEAWWPNGQKRFEYHYKNDLYEGLQQEWFANGQLYSSKNFLHGYEHGMQQNWDSTGGILANYEARNGRNYGNIGQKHCKSIFIKDSFTVHN